MVEKPAVSEKPVLKFPLGLVSEGVRPYLELIRLEKPTGTILMFWPFIWGLTMAAYTVGLPLNAYFAGVGKAFVAAFLLRSSACTINDIFDRKMDAGVERCKTRPLASGRISVVAATLYLLSQYAAGVAFFLKTEQGFPLQVALFQLIPLFGIYPLMKRVTYWPQAWLGFAMNFGFITAWVSVTGTVNYPIIAAAMASTWCWTMLYDTIYACQDMKDDIKVGVRSTAILFGTWLRPLLVLFGIVFVSLLAVAGSFNGQGTPYFVVSIGGTLLHLIWQFRTVDLDVPKSCWRNFNSNGELGWIVWGGLMLDYVLRHRATLSA
ncbi:4-hydroxybenzoate polyprenyltransferase, mitochondrial [Mycena venus]|uniref:4-hydroxybenzoate polyprenyltransferase, mitochondrial n=1 Tax=Mycena venus TaxID=2733690 RepID=A0A8H6YMQ2_9AGAR|nr:4-hydroxybenzoate polyprenyltransferase, mitochondrial [Mycena venus]